ncbi:MAG: hypothetical protein CMO74_09900 [Verrucomicrobiales bacterium]|nr:hypothetical protein [Verrucomicrobiales bacterium]|tara:strand:- start:8012 stop:10426 length:2415 start_codon:yes stop_codon:yes gene_type:complete
MTFLNGILLWGTAAVSIPVLIHLFNKNRYRTLQWGAMHLLDTTNKVQKRRLRLENWFLMLLRMMIPLLLAACLAQPQILGTKSAWDWVIVAVFAGLALATIMALARSRAPMVAWLFCVVIFALPGWVIWQLATFDGKGRFQWGDRELSVALVMDDSYSLEYEDASGKPFDKGRKLALQLVGELRKGSDVQVIRMPGGPVYSKPRTILDNVADDLKEMKAGYGMADPPEAFRSVANLMAPGKMAHGQREVVVVTDFQKVSWGSNRIAALKENLKDMRMGQNPPRVTLLRAGKGEKDNLAVMSLEYPRLPLAPKQELQVRAVLQNFSRKDRQDLPVTFRVDGQPTGPRGSVAELGKGQKDVAVTGQGEPFKHSFEKPGTHVVEVVADQDKLRADNSYLASVKVWDNVPVLVVDGEPSKESLAGRIDFKGESDFLRIALQPFREVKYPGMTDLFDVRVVAAEDFDADAAKDAHVVVMANVPRLTEGKGGQLEALTDYVKQGGGVLWFMGDQVDVDWYNQHLAPMGLIPAPLKEVRNREGEPTPYATVDSSRPFEHAALEMFTGRSTITSEIHQWMTLVEQPDDPPYSEMARLSTGDLYLVERKVDDGRVLLCTTTCDEEWLQGILREYYVPLMQQLVVYLASSVAPERNLSSGQPVVAHFPPEEVGQEAVLAYYRPEEVDALTVKLQGRAGEKHHLKIAANGARGTVRFEDTQRPGLYVLRRPDNTVEHYVVNTDRAESDLTPLEESEIEKLAEDLDVQVVDSLEDYKGAENDRASVLDIWKWLLWSVLILCLGELILQQWMTREKA